MGKLSIGLLAFAGGALAGGLLVKWYVERHYAGLAGEKIAAALGFSEGSAGARITSGLLNLVDEVRA